MDARLPTPRAWTAATWINGKIYTFGGATNNGPTAEVVSVTLLPTGNYFATNRHGRLPSPRFAHAAVFGQASRLTNFPGR